MILEVLLQAKTDQALWQVDREILVEIEVKVEVNVC